MFRFDELNGKNAGLQIELQTVYFTMLHIFG